jgi:hypothetical protein
MTVRSATLLRVAFSAIRLAHLQDLREWITRPSRSRRRFIFSCSVGPARRDHCDSPSGAAKPPRIKWSRINSNGCPCQVDARIYARDLCARGSGRDKSRRRYILTRREMWLRINSLSGISKNDQQQQKRTTQRPSTPHF